MANSPIACATCGTQIQNPGKRRKYCSTACKNRRVRERGARSRPERILSRTYKCWWCGVEYHPKRTEQNKCCSRECGFQWMGFKRSVKSGVFTVRHVVTVARCNVCSKSYKPKSVRSVACSEECQREYSAIAARHLAEKRYKPRVFDCHECGAQVTTTYGATRDKFCSDECLKRNFKRKSRKRERARIRLLVAEPIDPIKVFERDGWMCQHCGVKTPRRLRGTTSPKAPEMDHIEPLAKGGDHTYKNVQCLCRSCNCAKADGPGGQLRLFG